MPRPSTSATNVSAPSRNPAAIGIPPDRDGSIIVRNDSISDAGRSGSVGSCAGDRTAQRPSTWIAS